MSARLLSSSLWTEIGRLARKAKRKKAAIAYCTEDKLHLKRGDVLVCDASDACIKAGSTSAELLAKLLKQGVKLFSLPGLHAKVISFGDSAVIGSANMSMNADTGHRIEASLVTRSPEIVSQVESLIHQLVSTSITLKLIEISRLRGLPVTKRRKTGLPSSRKGKLADTHGNVWLTSLHEIADPSTETARKDLKQSELRAKEKLEDEKADLVWYRFPNTSKISKRARPGDTVIEAWRENYKETPEGVFRYISIIQIDRKPSFTRIWVEAPAAADDSEITWKQFLRIAGKAALTFTPKRTSTRLLNADEARRLFALWPK
jgi:hypothetical protein